MKEKYGKFFGTVGVNAQSGEMLDGSHEDRKFACYPYIGSKYGCGRKVLFVGLDIGADENVGDGIQSFEWRRAAIEDRCVKCHNPHIAGTYFTAMKYAGPEHHRNLYCERFKRKERTCRALLKEGGHLPDDNPLSYVVLTNYYKWVKKGSCTRAFKRFNVNEDAERNLFLEEMRALNPDLVIFQSTKFCEARFRNVWDCAEKDDRAWLVLPHPSFPNARKQWPGYVATPKCGGGKALREVYR